MNQQLAFLSNRKNFMAEKLFYPLILALLFVNLTCTAKSLDDYLSQGDLDKGMAHFTSKLSRQNHNDEEAFSLAVLQFFDGIENLTQSLYKYGLKSDIGRQANLPFLRLPIPTNPDPERVTSSALYEVLNQFHFDMQKTNNSLSKVSGQGFNVPLDLANIRLDINHNKQYEDSESFRQIYLSYNRQASTQFKQDEAFIVNFDNGDALWLQGYTHLLMAMTDTLLAHDGSKVFEYSAHLFFPNVETPMGEMLRRQSKNQKYITWVDLFIGFHVMNMDVTEPERLSRAHGNLLKTIELSRKMWNQIESETDNLNEWIPNPNQESVNGVQISAEMITGWMDFLTEFEAILTGEKLIPHWRFNADKGVNLKKVMFEPQSFDLFLWIQGSAAIPYLESGNISTEQDWRRITRVFGGNFIGFAIWVN
jgi:hypothetical protein